MDGQPMTIDFDCGATATNVGELGMALKHHLSECDDPQCVADVNATLKQYGYK